MESDRRSSRQRVGLIRDDESKRASNNFAPKKDTNDYDRNSVFYRRVQSKKLKGVRWTICIILSFFFATWACWLITVFHCSLIFANGQGLGLFLITTQDSDGNVNRGHCTWYTAEQMDTYFDFNQTIGRIFGAIGLGCHTVALIMLLIVMIVTSTDAIPNARSKMLLEQSHAHRATRRLTVDAGDLKKSNNNDSDSDSDDEDERESLKYKFKSSMRNLSRLITLEETEEMLAERGPQPKIVKTLHRLWRMKQILLFLSFGSLGATSCFATLEFCTDFGVDETDDTPTTENMIPTFLGIDSCKPGVAGILALINGFLLFDLIILSFCIDFNILFESRINKSTLDEEDDPYDADWFNDEETSNSSSNNKRDSSKRGRGSLRSSARSSSRRRSNTDADDSSNTELGGSERSKDRGAKVGGMGKFHKMQQSSLDEAGESFRGNGRNVPMSIVYEESEDEMPSPATDRKKFNSVDSFNLLDSAQDDEKDKNNNDNRTNLPSTTPLFNEKQAELDDLIERLNKATAAVDELQDMVNLNTSSHSSSPMMANTNENNENAAFARRLSDVSLSSNVSTISDLSSTKSDTSSFADDSNDKAKRKKRKKKKDQIYWKNPDKMAQAASLDVIDENNEVGDFNETVDKDVSNRITSWLDGETLSVDKSNKKEKKKKKKKKNTATSIGSATTKTTSSISSGSTSSSVYTSNSSKPSAAVESSAPPRPPPSEQQTEMPKRRGGRRNPQPQEIDISPPSSPKLEGNSRARRGRRRDESPFESPYETPMETPPRGKRRRPQQQQSSASLQQQAEMPKRSASPEPRRASRSASPPPSRPKRGKKKGEAELSSSSRGKKDKRRRKKRGEAYSDIQGIQPMDLIDDSKLGQGNVMALSDDSDDSSINISGIIRTSLGSK